MGGEGGAPLEAFPALLALENLVQAVDRPVHNVWLRIMSVNPENRGLH